MWQVPIKKQLLGFESAKQTAKQTLFCCEHVELREAARHGTCSGFFVT